MHDELGAFCPGPQPRISGASEGPLSGLTFAAKDLFDIEGHVTGAGNPDWARTHEAATVTAPAVLRLLEAGADLVGKTITDELAYSLNGENHHYGAPVNPAAPDRVTGGSSCGSASAVAGGAVDFALGSDTGGSVRVPASYCGLFGIRPTHGAVPIENVVPLSPGFDTVGWFARDAALLEKVGDVLLPEAQAEPFSRLCIAQDLFDALSPEMRDAFAPALESLGALESVILAPLGLETGFETFRVLQARQAHETHGDWIKAVKPVLGPGVRERLAWAATITDEQVRDAKAKQAEIVRHMGEVLRPGTLLVLPSAPGPAPLRDISTAAERSDRHRALVLSFTAPASLAGTPQVSMPLAQAPPAQAVGAPVGLSVMGRRGTDRALLAWVRDLFASPRHAGMLGDHGYPATPHRGT